MSFPESHRWSAGRRFVAGSAGAVAAVVWTHAVAAVLRQAFGSAGDPADTAELASGAALPLTLAALAVAALTAYLSHRPARSVALGGLGGGALAALAIAPAAGVAAFALPPVGVAVGVGAHELGRRLPAAVDHALSRRRAIALGWTLLALVAVVQTARLATATADPSHELVLGTEHPFWKDHQCFSAYVYGAELAARGAEDVYDPAHYPGLNPEAEPATAVEGMAVEDPYQYPPQFLLLPRAALALTDDFTTMRTVWLALQVTLFAAVFTVLALWIGGRAGGLALWLAPAVLASFPVLYNFQYGQFHLAAVILAVGGMLAFAAGRRAGGGFLLAAAILAKMFPAVLLVPLLVRRRFRELAWTAGWGLALTALALAVFGPAPFVAFLGEHLPRLGDGSAFAFDEAWPVVADLVVADNQGVYGLARKLGLGKPVAAHAGRIFGLLVLVAAGLAAHRLRGSSRWARGVLWLSLLGLASLASPGAWGDYVPSVAVWLLALVALRAVDDRRWRIPLAVAAPFQVFLLGTYPIGPGGEWAPMALMLPLSAAGAVLMLGLFATVLVVRPGGWAAGALRGVGERPLAERAA
ncbi:MAG: glycosyltransferase family 87 protein [Acidobacteriota bacterium]|jgi:hypothetical protein